MTAIPKNLESLNVKQLLKLEQDVAVAMARKFDQAEKARETLGSELSAKLAKMVSDLGLPPAQANVAISFGPGKNGHAKRKGGKVAPKFRNPLDHAQTWTGRGRMPTWMVKAGGNKEQFAIR